MASSQTQLVVSRAPAFSIGRLQPAGSRDMPKTTAQVDNLDRN